MVSWCSERCLLNNMVNRKLNQSRVQINIAMLSCHFGALHFGARKFDACQFGAFHFGARNFDACQFGAFHFGARNFDACQFGAFQFDVVPVRRVSLWRDASLARFTLTWSQFGAFHFDACQFGAFQFDVVPVRRVSLWRVPVWRISIWRGPSSARFTLARCQFGAFHFGAFPIFVPTYADPVSAKYSFARTIFRISAEKSCLCLFARMFPFCEEVFSTPVWRVSLFACARSVSICAHVSFLRRSVFYPSFGTYLVLRLCWSSVRVWRVARVAYKFDGMFPFCEEVGFFMRVSLFCVFFLCVSCILLKCD